MVTKCRVASTSPFQFYYSRKMASNKLSYRTTRFLWWCRQITLIKIPIRNCIHLIQLNSGSILITEPHTNISQDKLSYLIQCRCYSQHINLIGNVYELYLRLFFSILVGDDAYQRPKIILCMLKGFYAQLSIHFLWWYQMNCILSQSRIPYNSSGHSKLRKIDSSTTI